MGGTLVIHITRPDQKTPKQFNTYLANGRNKELQIEFLFQCWTRCDPGILRNVLLVILHDEVCHSIVVNDAAVAVTEVPDLFSDREKADTRLLILAHQAAQVFSSVTIKSPDTDIMVLFLAKSRDFHGCLLLFMTGSGSNNRIINITELGIKLGQEKNKAILGLHIFTGYDSISAFKGGKQLVYKWMEHSPAPQYVLKSINCKCKKCGCKGTCSWGLPCTDYCQYVRELCANRPSHEVVGSGCDYDTDSDDADVDLILNNLKVKCI